MYRSQTLTEATSTCCSNKETWFKKSMKSNLWRSSSTSSSSSSRINPSPQSKRSIRTTSRLSQSSNSFSKLRLNATSSSPRWCPTLTPFPRTLTRRTSWSFCSGWTCSRRTLPIQLSSLLQFTHIQQTRFRSKRSHNKYFWRHHKRITTWSSSKRASNF